CHLQLHTFLISDIFKNAHHKSWTAVIIPISDHRKDRFYPDKRFIFMDSAMFKPKIGSTIDLCIMEKFSSPLNVFRMKEFIKLISYQFFFGISNHVLEGIIGL